MAAACNVTGALNVTVDVPCVPEEIYPAVTCGVLDTFVFVNVIVPELVEIVADVAVIEDAGLADPDATVAVA